MKHEKLVKRLKVSAVILLAATVLTVWMAAASAQIAHQALDDDEMGDNYYKIIWYDAEEISKPSTYWILEEGEADPYIQEALTDLGHFSHCFANETTFLQQVYDHDAVWEIEFEGCYYSTGACYCYDGPGLMPKFYTIHFTLSKQLQKGAVASGVMLPFAWIAVGVVWFKKVKQT
ncbi:MAG: hypothetical protein OEW62_05940 [Candidatus Bathyarchaeota archaeon]|nr:hypothetical protein [Candidatus Bathyarchaeota archaeon]